MYADHYTHILADARAELIKKICINTLFFIPHLVLLFPLPGKNNLWIPMLLATPLLVWGFLCFRWLLDSLLECFRIAVFTSFKTLGLLYLLGSFVCAFFSFYLIPLLICIYVVKLARLQSTNRATILVSAAAFLCVTLWTSLVISHVAGVPAMLRRWQATIPDLTRPLPVNAVPQWLPAASSAPAPAFTRSLYLEAPGKRLHGQDVQVVQHRLANLGYEVGEIDGYFGPKTQKAVQQFQTDHHLEVSGVVNYETWETLRKLSHEE